MVYFTSPYRGIRRSFVAAATLVAFTASAAQAHAIWFAERATQLAMIYGVGADDLDMVKRLPLVKDPSGYDAQWQKVPTTLRASGPIVVVDSEAPITAATAWMDYGMWTKTPDGEWHKKGKDEVPNAIFSERTMKYAVHVEGASTRGMPAFADQTLQIMPVDGAIPQKMGEPMKLKVLFQGKPVADAAILHDMVNDPDQTPVKTGPDGTATINVRNQGLNVVAAILFGPSDQPAKYDRIEYRATLSFVLPHLPE